MEFDSARYWSQRYARGGTSEAGPYGHLAAYKAHFLNMFVMANDVRSVVELGCGDGNQLSLARYPLYVGFDVSHESLSLCEKRFDGASEKYFLPMAELEGRGASAFPADLALSLDVLFHLTEDEVYQNHIKYLFALSLKYVIIYAPHALYSNGYHVKCRPFLHDVNFEEWELVNSLDNPFAWNPEDPQATTFSRFYVFARRGAGGAIVPSIGNKGVYKLAKDDVDAFQTIKGALRPDMLQCATPMELVRNYMGGVPAMRFLDLGCGAGESFTELKNAGFTADWVGCDIADSDEVRSRMDDSRHFVTFDGVNLPFENASFDVVFSRQVFEHVEYPHELMREIARVLRPGGYFIGSVSQLEPYHSRSISQFTCYGFEKLAERAGLSAERFALGADAATLLNRRMDGRNAGYQKRMDARSGGVYGAIARADRETGEDSRITLYKQMLCAGQFAFVLTHERTTENAFPPQSGYIRARHPDCNTSILHMDRNAFNEDWHRIAPKLQPIQPQRETPLVVSLTSYPDRLPRLHLTLYSLLQQNTKPDVLILWLAEEEFPELEESLPEHILFLKQFGLTIRFCKNIRSYKKIIPSLLEYPGSVLVTADDDAFYLPEWLSILYNSYKEHPLAIHAHMTRCIKWDIKGEMRPYGEWEYDDASRSETLSSFYLPIGLGGVLYPRGIFHEDVLKSDRFLSLAPDADDIWLWSMAVLHGTKIHTIREKNPVAITTYPERDLGLTQESRLCVSNLAGGNDRQLHNVIKAYPQLLPMLKKAWEEESHP